MITTAHALLTQEPDCDADRVAGSVRQPLPLHRLHLVVEAVLDARSAYGYDGGQDALRDPPKIR